MNEKKYVSRGGEKLAGAWEAFGFSVEGRTCLDVGVSTGGFMDFLLQHGARLVMGVDVGYGDVAYNLRIDPRVVLFERTNARLMSLDVLLTHKGWKAASEEWKTQKHQCLADISLVVMDVSFISILKILPTLKMILPPDFEVVSLVKPQFEARKEEVGTGGIIRDEGVHDLVLERTKTGAVELGFEVLGVCDSPILGGKGNREFFMHLRSR